MRQGSDTCGTSAVRKQLMSYQDVRQWEATSRFTQENPIGLAGGLDL